MSGRAIHMRARTARRFLRAMLRMAGGRTVLAIYISEPTPAGIAALSDREAAVVATWVQGRA